MHRQARLGNVSDSVNIDDSERGDLLTEELSCANRTEVTCGSIIQHEPSDSGTVGKLLPNHKMRLVDESEKDVDFGSPGEILIQAPNVMLGYWRNEKATQETIGDGWLRTGDVAVINKEGLIWIVDQKKELIKVNALQVAPAELEGLLLDCEHVADTAVVGITIHDEEWPRAYVVLTDEAKKAKITPKDIQSWFKPRVAKHKALVGGVQFVDEIVGEQSLFDVLLLTHRSRSCCLARSKGRS